MSRVRVRFAPSPTGYVHVGNVRTALFNWLFARHEDGTLVLRIEDTDIERSRDEYERQLTEDLRWFGLDWQEGPEHGGAFGPYRQSQRKELYHRCAIQLIDQQHAYYCFCSPVQLEAEREAALKAGEQPRYSGRCRTRPREEAARKVAEGQPAAIRLRIPQGELTWDDLVHGPVSFSSEVIGDFILVRSDGHPTYNYTVVIDDHLMEITHVIRGDDHISNTPRQLALYQALSWAPPRFAHLSSILGPDRARLSKRHGATSLQNFRQMGVLPEALMNYLALLGWSPHDGTTEILSREDLIAQFSLNRLTKAPAVFDFDKLKWMNRHYMKQCPVRRLAELSVPILQGAGYLRVANSNPSSTRPQTADLGLPGEILAWLDRAIDAVLKNLDLLSQLPEATRLIFEYDAARIATGEETRYVTEEPGSREVLKRFISKVTATNGLDYERFREAARSVQQETGRKGKDLFHPIRVAVTGAVSGPELEKLIPIFEEGARLPLDPPIKSTVQRLREFAAAAKLD
jgi:nondiscriminating glutamyl-tRNA synthetase